MITEIQKTNEIPNALCEYMEKYQVKQADIS